MKKIKKLFLTIGILVLVVFYPIISFNWYRFCKKKNDTGGAKKCALYGILGIIGIVGFVGMWFVPFPSWQHGIVTIIASVSYGVGSYKQIKLIIEKREKPWKRFS
jgi:hypothetical protein